ncbi:hypothetical protein K1719_004405 [Acacia pycnantha]|nr:hypothetical protein K1719_004405 [Acacia pycnantha]
MQEIAWHWLDELQPASGEVISRGITGVKLYMVAPFLRSLNTRISEHPPPIQPRPDLPLKEQSSGSSSMPMDSQAAVVMPEPDSHVFAANYRSFKFDMDPVRRAMQDGLSS